MGVLHSVSCRMARRVAQLTAGSNGASGLGKTCTPTTLPATPPCTPSGASQISSAYA